MKQCFRCKEHKPFKDFHKNKSKKDGLTTYCKICQLEYLASRPENVQNRRRELKRIREARYRRTKLGVTPEQYDAMLELQNNTCAICKQACRTGKALAVDHDHKTGQVRGLLCMACNTAIGKFQDDAELLRSAISYLESQGSRSEAL